ncbi:MAG: hypothetical protein AAFZ65_13005, partial [Planctomycetota bacterium]
MSFDWLDAAEAAGHDYTPTASADWQRAVAGLPADLVVGGRIETLHVEIDRWGERRAALRSDPFLSARERTRRLEAVDREAAERLREHVDLLREVPLLLQLAYVLAKQTQEEARLSFLPLRAVEFGRRLAELEGDERARRGAALVETYGDLIERYEGLELQIGDLVHEGVEQRELERAAASLDRAALREVEELGVERGLAEGRRMDAERARAVERRLERRLGEAPFTDRRRRRAGRRTFERGIERGLEDALDADRRASAVLEALTRRVDLKRLERLEEGLSGARPEVRELVLSSEGGRHRAQ